MREAYHAFVAGGCQGLSVANLLYQLLNDSFFFGGKVLFLNFVVNCKKPDGIFQEQGNTPPDNDNLPACRAPWRTFWLSARRPFLE